MRSTKLSVVLVLAGCISGHDTPGKDQPTPEPLAGAQGPTATGNVDRGYVGVLTPDKTAEITAPFTTTVSEFLVNLGDHVEVGDKIAVLDDKPLLEELAIAKAELKGHRAEVAQASVSSKAAKAALRREKEGLKDQVSSRADVDAAGFKSREAGTMVAHAAASVEEQKARIAQLEAKLADMTVTAPIAGKVSLRYVEPGSRVEEGQPVVRVISTGAVVVKFAIPGDQMGKVTQGQPIDVLVEGGERMAGVVKSVAPELDPVAQMILAEAELTDRLPENLQSGMVCRVQPRVTAAAGAADHPPAAAAATAVAPSQAAATEPTPTPVGAGAPAPTTATAATATVTPPATATPTAPPAALPAIAPAAAIPAVAPPAAIPAIDTSTSADPATAPPPAPVTPTVVPPPPTPAHRHHSH